MTFDAPTLQAALADLRERERDLSRQLMKTRGGIESIERLLSAAAEVTATEMTTTPAPTRALPAFSEQLAQYRRRAHMSKKALAQAAKLDSSSLHFFENTGRIPRRDTVARLVTALDLNDEDAGRFMAAAGYTFSGKGIAS